ncbi:MAG: hypothetical protein KBA87_02740 [Lachnospiraceae bacterium]|nr:hypothetical protein [Lachnospiraceae bacterium]
MKKYNILLSISVIVATFLIYFVAKIPAQFPFYALVTVILVPVFFNSLNFNLAYKLLIAFLVDGGGFALLFFLNHKEDLYLEYCFAFLIISLVLCAFESLKEWQKENEDESWQ